MNFLSPTFLYGLFFLLVPLLIHFFTKKKYANIEFSSLNFIILKKKKEIKFHTFSNLLLLILKMIAISLFITSFSKPIIKGEIINRFNTSKLPSSVVFVVDNSASMSYNENGISLLDKTKNSILTLLSLFSSSDELTLILTNKYYYKSPIQISGYNNILNFLNTDFQSEGNSLLLNTLRNTIDFLNKSNIQNKYVFVFSDFCNTMLVRNGGIKTSFNRHNIKFFITPLAVSENDNVGLSDITLPEINLQNEHINLQPKIYNYSNIPKNEKISLWLDNKIIDEKIFHIAGNKELSLNYPVNETLKEGIYNGFFLLPEDNNTLDNKIYFNLNIKKTLNILLIGRKTLDLLSSDFYIKNAFKSLGNEFNLYETYPEDLVDLDKYDAVILSDNANEKLIDKLESFVKKNKRLLIIPSTKVDIQSMNKLLKRTMGIMIENIEEGKEGIYYSPGGNSNLASLEGIKFKKLLKINKLDEQLKELLKFNNGDPFLIEKIGDKRKILFVTSSFSPLWGNLVFKVNFIPFFHDLIIHLCGGNLQFNENFHVGDIFSNNKVSQNDTIEITKDLKKGVKIIGNNLLGNYLLTSGIYKKLNSNYVFTVNVKKEEFLCKKIENEKLIFSLNQILPQKNYRIISTRSFSKITNLLENDLKVIKLDKLFLVCAIFLFLLESALSIILL